jgi:hypothetical protein
LPQDKLVYPPQAPSQACIFFIIRFWFVKCHPSSGLGS